ncbi:MAG: hypothetical protein WCJ96_10010 [Verrucomicrobiota bacterium]|jgi:hypothetical protein
MAAATAPETEPEPTRETKKIGSIQRRFWEIGKEGLFTSLLFHALLLITATAWVVVVHDDRKDPNSFVTGSSGGGGGDRVAPQHKVRPQGPKSLSKSVTRIASKAPDSQITLPPMPDLNRNLLSGTANAASKGFGGAMGANIGRIGNGGKNFVGKTVMGMKIGGSRIAVYLDNSYSMIPYLDDVEKQIKLQFPGADVFRYFGIFVRVENGEVMGSTLNKKFEEDTVEQLVEQRKGRNTTPVGTNLNKLSPQGRTIYNMRDAQFKVGSIGAWTDYMMSQHYDALVVFTDFEDGIQQWRRVKDGRPRLVFDADWRPRADERNEDEKAWEKRWLAQFAKAPAGKAPRLYLFSTEMEPQDLWKQCVEVSGGEIRMVKVGKKGL